jgi:hypothetical protein
LLISSASATKKAATENFFASRPIGMPAKEILVAAFVN